MPDPAPQDQEASEAQGPQDTQAPAQIVFIPVPNGPDSVNWPVFSVQFMQDGALGFVYTPEFSIQFFSSLDVSDVLVRLVNTSEQAALAVSAVLLEKYGAPLFLKHLTPEEILLQHPSRTSGFLDAIGRTAALDHFSAQ